MDDELKQLLRDYLLRMHEDEATRGPVQKLLRDTLDLATFPTDLTRVLSLAPPLYNPGTRRFEFQRTPNVFPVGLVGVNGQGGTSITKATALIVAGGNNFTMLTDLKPKDGMAWRVLGGVLSAAAAGNYELRQEGGAKVVWSGALLLNTAQPFAIPGNGVQLDPGKSIEMIGTQVTNVLFNLYVVEEGDTMGRGGV